MTVIDHKLRRAFCYYAQNVFSFMSVFPFWLLFRLTEPWREGLRFGSIRIYDITHKNGKSGDSCDLVMRALLLIRKADPRRFRRIQRQCSLVINARLKAHAKYQPIGKICLICLAKMDEGTRQEQIIERVAGTIVHEATHGEIEARRIAFTKRTRKRIEGICVIEAARHLRCLARFRDDPDE
jgi:hypothetical protein